MNVSKVLSLFRLTYLQPEALPHEQLVLQAQLSLHWQPCAQGHPAVEKHPQCLSGVQAQF